MDDSKKVQSFFVQRARAFDSYYSETEKNFLRKILDALLRASMKRRLELTIQECRDMSGAGILDVGCGSGRYAVALARLGARQVTGVDFSQPMIELARSLAKENGVENKCRFIIDDFKTRTFDGKFDICLALGFFDYTREPQEYLKKMCLLTTGKIIATFPARWRLRNIIRIIRLKVLGCPVYFYTPGEIKEILKAAAISRYSLQNIGRDYFLIAYP
ncbi:MAG TPA: methyltransferase domain-containing protein [Candidatus Omnitrophota bacterium]|nr:methyltransferase domain-containing protein [Candidatus Omnitrophota bacterium]HPD84318.1 methyltransferase domain-containing protein [Candidatus Omnitrophota bacterium]HRZ03176.1 methyltransferase domain-containing protein [Candidatus Omnitrophota bacterium]